VGAVVVIQQCCHLGVGQQRDIPAITAVTAIRAAQGLELLPVNGDTSVAAVTRRQVQHNAVNERCHRITFLLSGH
jgi:hypothetical protein